LFLFFQGPWCPQLWRTLARKQENFDLVVCGGYLYAPTVKALESLSGKKRTLLVTMAHNEPEFFLPFVRKAILRSDALGFLSESEKELVEKVWPEARTKATLFLHPGLNKSHTSSEHEPKEIQNVPERYLLYVGRVDAHKGVQFLLDTLPNSLPLVFAGDLAMTPEPQPNRIYLGRVTDEVRDKLIKNAAALVIASRFESYSMVTADALAMGTPVLALKGCGPIDELIRHYGGISCDSGDFASWAERLFAGELLPEELRPKPSKIKLERDWQASAQKLIAFAQESRNA
jgi:glycosyltransferase involved in cell wall biosynthesis